MIKVKVDDRAALERAYPPDAYAADSAENSAVSNEAVSGVRILSAPDSAGEFSLERGRRQVGEAASGVFYRALSIERQRRRPGSGGRQPARRLRSLSSMRSPRRRADLVSTPKKRPAEGIRESAGCGNNAVGN